MLHKNYSSWHITNPGEKETDKQLAPASELDEPFYVIHSLRISSRFHRKQMAGEIDFVVMSRLGIMVVEVKGGIIGYGERGDGSTGYFRSVGDGEQENLDDPFIQVDGNADAVKKYLLQKNLKNIFVGSMVCFPECEFSRESFSEDDLWHRGHPQNLPMMILDSMEQQIEDFRQKELSKGSSHYIPWMEIDDESMEKISKALEPEFDPARYRKSLKINIEENERRREQGLSILKGLEENQRIMIQGPPGSGKTVFALHMIDRLCRTEGLKGLYICWNELLLEEMGSRLSEANLDITDYQLQRVLYYDLITSFADACGDVSLAPTYENIKKGEMRQLVKSIVSKLKKGKVPGFDFVIVDEAQDLFDKGLDLAMKVILKDNNPIQKGTWVILYDDSQDYPSDGMERELYVRTRDYLKSLAATYTLTDSLRAGAGKGIRELILDTMHGRLDTEKTYGPDVIIREWRDEENLLGQVRQMVTQEKALGSLSNDEIIVLLSSELHREGHAVRKAFDTSELYERVTPENYSLQTEKIRYTSMLKAKGLERSLVLLVCGRSQTKADLHQLFIGASRAKAKICLLVQKSISVI